MTLKGLGRAATAWARRILGSAMLLVVLTLPLATDAAKTVPSRLAGYTCGNSCGAPRLTSTPGGVGAPYGVFNSGGLPQVPPSCSPAETVCQVGYCDYGGVHKFDVLASLVCPAGSTRNFYNYNL